MYDINRLGELERIPLTEFKFLVGGFEVYGLNFSIIISIFREGFSEKD